MLPRYSPEHGDGYIAPQEPDRRAIGDWLYGIAARFDTYRDRHPGHGRKIDAVFEAFIEFDAAPRDWLRAAGVGGLHDTELRRLRREAANRSVLAKRRLAAFTRIGLEARKGQRLHEQQRVWIHLCARGFEHPSLRVCEQCEVVFAAPRAKRCPDCRRSPIRIRLHPLEAGEWHVDYRVGDRWASEEFDRTVHYTTQCQSCSARFDTTSADRRLCRNCGTPSGRVRRHRGGSRTGRQRFRYVHADGEREWSTSFATLDGKAVQLVAANGIIETDDAEVARILDMNSVVRRLEGD